MTQSTRIPTPLRQHIHRFRLGVLPVLLWLICVAATLWLWQRQAYEGTMVGEVEAFRLDVPAGADGLLVAPEGSFVQLFESVKKDQVIAQLDNRAAQARMKMVLAEIKKLDADLEEARAQLKLDVLDVTQRGERERMRAAVEVDRRKLEVMQQSAIYQTANAELAGVEAQLKMLAEAERRVPGTVSPLQIEELETDKRKLQAEATEAKKVGTEAKLQYDQAVKTLQGFPEVVVPNEDSVLGPIRAEVAVQEAAMEEVQAELDSLIIRAPADGTIGQIYRWPGQRVAASDPIVTIIRADSQYVVSYVRERQRIPIVEGMPVGLRVRHTAGGVEYKSRIETVGPHVEPVPPHQLADQGTPEWATPIRIPLPPELKQQNVRPGQLLQVIVRRPESP